MSLLEAVVRRGQEPPRHVHHREDEYFYSFGGRVDSTGRGSKLPSPPGTLVFLPRGVPHSFTMETEQARSLAIFTPAGIEGYFDGFLHLMKDPAAFRAKRQELQAQYGLEDLPEPPTIPNLP